MEKLLSQNKIVSLAALILACAIISTSYSYTGGQPGAYLRAPVGAAAFAMGGAQTADPGYMCSWWNPASLVLLDSRQLSLGTGLKSLGRAEGFLGWEFSIPPRAALGLSLLYRGDPYMSNLRDAQENKLDPASYTTMTVKIGLSYHATKKIAAGINSSIMYQRIPSSYENTKPEYSSVTSMGGFDIGMVYLLNPKVQFGMSIKNLLVVSNWEISSAYLLNVTVQDTFTAPITLGSRVETAFRAKPLIWTCDLKATALNSALKRLDYTEAALSTGAQWNRWETLYLRAGIGDIIFNRDLYDNSSDYWRDFNFRVSAGFFADLSKKVRGLGLNYAMSTDKVWAFIDQQIDFTYQF